jgi:pseudaminic acid cytidylyltransferase
VKLAVIPARGGSKRIPRKNIRPFHGKPMIAYAIQAALVSKAFDRVIVSTDDTEIAEVAKAHGAELPFIRPPELADDHTPTVPVIAHAIQQCHQLGWDVEEACCIYPGVPFISANDLLLAREKLLESDAHYVFPVTGFPSPIQRALRRLPDGSVKPFHPEYAATLNLHLNGVTFVIPEWRVVDIDTPADWERAELLLATLSKSHLL